MSFSSTAIPATPVALASVIPSFLPTPPRPPSHPNYRFYRCELEPLRTTCYPMTKERMLDTSLDRGRCIVYSPTSMTPSRDREIVSKDTIPPSLSLETLTTPTILIPIQEWVPKVADTTIIRWRLFAQRTLEFRD